MSWDAVGAIAEFLGAIAVFVTVAYLAVQIRQNTSAVRSAAVDASIQSVNEMRMLLAQSSEIAEIYINGSRDPESLNEVEYMRYRATVQVFLWAAWNMFSQDKKTETGLWSSQRLVIKRILLNPGGTKFLEDFGEEFDKDFQNEIASILKDG
jgi:hypothetical protein